MKTKLYTQYFRVVFLGDFYIHGYDWFNGFP
jgi:hypothetical protein